MKNEVGLKKRVLRVVIAIAIALTIAPIVAQPANAAWPWTPKKSFNVGDLVKLLDFGVYNPYCVDCSVPYWWNPPSVGSVMKVIGGPEANKYRLTAPTKAELRSVGIYYQRSYSNVWVYRNSLVLLVPIRPQPTPWYQAQPTASLPNEFYNPPTRKSSCPYGWEEKYTVLPGDTAWSIAWRHGFLDRLVTFMSINKLTNSTVLQPGQVLCTPTR